jgi:hypothetical protein
MMKRLAHGLALALLLLFTSPAMVGSVITFDENRNANIDDVAIHPLPYRSIDPISEIGTLAYPIGGSRATSW